MRPTRPSAYQRVTKYPALLLLAVVYVLSAGVVYRNWRAGRGTAGGTEKIVLRIAHWQLEPGIRDGIQWAISEYEKLHPNVEVRQILIPETGYFEYVNTQLIGNTAPDMIECGLGGSADLWQKFYSRYFLSLDEYTDVPNPYNEGTVFEGVPWRMTYFDAMAGGYEESFQSHFRIGLSAFTARLFYNVDMVREVWDPAVEGCEFPVDFEQFRDLCQRLGKAHAGEEFSPMSGASYGFDRINEIFRTAFTANYLDVADTDFGGSVDRVESGAVLYSGRVSFLDPPIRANFELLKEVADFSPPGSTSLQRDEAVFLFLQGHAAMMLTGSWDYSSLAEQVQFHMAVTDFPLPSKDDPQYSRYVAGQPTEADTRAYFPFGVVKNSGHVAQAMDFLRFVGSLTINEGMNQRMYWIPAVEGAKPRPELRPFMPRVEGFSAAIEFDAPNTKLAYDQERPLYVQGKESYEKFVEDYMGRFRKDLPEGVQDFIRTNNETINSQMYSIALRRAAANGVPGAKEAVIGEALEQYQRLAEAFGGQIMSREHDARTWVANVRLWERANAQ